MYGESWDRIFGGNARKSAKAKGTTIPKAGVKAVGAKSAKVVAKTAGKATTAAKLVVAKAAGKPKATAAKAKTGAKSTKNR